MTREDLIIKLEKEIEEIKDDLHYHSNLSAYQKYLQNHVKSISSCIEDIKSLDVETVKLCEGCRCIKPIYTFNEVKQQLICSCGSVFKLHPE